ncbi:hypothetical protein B0T21DRAFT_435091 [Apiosordaria backusii]|uniref:Uncharacterized protein n=1 Tax=Apiosordaria backusii TaxID=314023 RepID=A0AA39ZPD3_9PEZI|nr:hypothetical protein B0T21DRAFT_435091 [Apiosordaria backusii]
MMGDIDYYRKMIPDSRVESIPLFSFSKLRARKTLDQEHRVDVRLQPSVTTKIKQLARKNHSTSFHVYLAALQTLLFRLLPEPDSLFIGIADANRTDKRFMHSIGFFLNLLPVRFDRPAAGFKAEGESNWHTAKSGYDVAFDAIENPAGDSLLTLKLQQGLYSPQHTELLLATYVHLLEAFTSSPSLDVPLDGPPLWPEAEVKKAIETGFGESMLQKWPETVSHRIDDMIRENPHKAAIKDGRGHFLTYRDLEQRVEAMSRRLVEEGECHNKIMGVFQEPAADWISSLLAIFCVGATYLPLDTRQSIPRLSSIIEQTKPMFILNDSTTAEKTKLLAVDSNTQFIDISTLPKSTLSVT